MECVCVFQLLPPTSSQELQYEPKQSKSTPNQQRTETKHHTVKLTIPLGVRSRQNASPRM